MTPCSEILRILLHPAWNGVTLSLPQNLRRVLLFSSDSKQAQYRFFSRIPVAAGSRATTRRTENRHAKIHQNANLLNGQT